MASEQDIIRLSRLTDVNKDLGAKPIVKKKNDLKPLIEKFIKTPTTSTPPPSYINTFYKVLGDDNVVSIPDLIATNPASDPEIIKYMAKIASFPITTGIFDAAWSWDTINKLKLDVEKIVTPPGCCVDPGGRKCTQIYDAQPCYLYTNKSTKADGSVEYGRTTNFSIRYMIDVEVTHKVLPHYSDGLPLIHFTIKSTRATFATFTAILNRNGEYFGTNELTPAQDKTSNNVVLIHTKHIWKYAAGNNQKNTYINEELKKASGKPLSPDIQEEIIKYMLIKLLGDISIVVEHGEFEDPVLLEGNVTYGPGPFSEAQNSSTILADSPYVLTKDYGVATSIIQTQGSNKPASGVILTQYSTAPSSKLKKKNVYNKWKTNK